MVHVTQPVSCRASVSPITSSHCHSLPVTASHCRKGKRFASTMENNAAMTASCSSMVLWKGTALLAPALACHRLPWFACRDNANDTYTLDILKHLDVAKGEVLEVQFAARGSIFSVCSCNKTYILYIYNYIYLPPPTGRNLGLKPNSSLFGTRATF